MSITFKLKTKKVDKRKNQIVETLDSKHLDMIKQLETLQNSLPTLQKLLAHHEHNLKKYKAQIETINQAISASAPSSLGDKNLVLDDKLYVAIYHEEEEIQKLSSNILKIQNNDYMNDYFLKTGHLLYDYYDGQKHKKTRMNNNDNDTDNEDDNDNDNDNDNDDNDNNHDYNNHIINDNKADLCATNDNHYDDTNNNEDNEDNDDDDDDDEDNDDEEDEEEVDNEAKGYVDNADNAKNNNEDNNEDKKAEEEDKKKTKKILSAAHNVGIAVRKTKITDFIAKDHGFDKADMYNRYIQLINNQTFIKKNIAVAPPSNSAGTAMCPKCNIDLTLIYSEGVQVCNMCGLTEYILIDSEKPSFREPPPEVSYFAYKRINHFNEWLSQFQAKESTEIPPVIYQSILLEMKKERITDLNKITHAKIREYLKKLKLNKYYEHIPHILNKLNKKVPLIGKETEDKLRQMFKEIQAPFMKICPLTRKNFLSYSYVLHKFVELVGLDHLKDAFPLLKSREKLHQQDQMWKEICKELNWMYIKSI